jgi:hypothetical protein
MPRKSVASRIEKHLRRNDWHFHKVPRTKGLFSTGFLVRGHPLDLLIHDLAAREVLLFLVPHIVYVERGRRTEFADILSKLNWDVLLGAFEMDHRDGEVRYKIALPTDDAVITDEQIGHCIEALWGTLEETYSEIIKSTFGRKAKRRSKRRGSLK